MIIEEAADTHTEHSPCIMTKADVTKHMAGFLEDNEYIKEWEMSRDGELRIWIYRKEEPQ